MLYLDYNFTEKTLLKKKIHNFFSQLFFKNLILWKILLCNSFINSVYSFINSFINSKPICYIRVCLII